jgi:hypothetical protein
MTTKEYVEVGLLLDQSKWLTEDTALVDCADMLKPVVGIFVSQILLLKNGNR